MEQTTTDAAQKKRWKIETTGEQLCDRCGCVLGPVYHFHLGRIYCDECIQYITIPTEVYSRIVGYLTPTQNWNAGKQQEFEDRAVFTVPVAEPLAREEI